MQANSSRQRELIAPRTEKNMLEASQSVSSNTKHPSSIKSQKQSMAYSSERPNQMQFSRQEQQSPTITLKKLAEIQKIQSDKVHHVQYNMQKKSNKYQNQSTHNLKKIIKQSFIISDKISKVCGKLQQKYFIQVKFKQKNQQSQSIINEIKKRDLVYLEQATTFDVLKSLIEQKISKNTFADVFIIDLQQTLQQKQIDYLKNSKNVAEILVYIKKTSTNYIEPINSKIKYIKDSQQLYTRLRIIRSTNYYYNVDQKQTEKYVQAFTIITGSSKEKIKKFRLNFDYFREIFNEILRENLHEMKSKLKNAFLKFIKIWLDWLTDKQKYFKYQIMSDMIQDIFTGKADGTALINFYTHNNSFHIVLNKSLRILTQISQFYYIAYPFCIMYNFIHQKYRLQVPKIRLISNFQNHNVYRCSYLVEQSVKRLQESIGHYIEIQGFISTTTNQKIAQQFKSFYSYYPQNYYIFVIEIPNEIYESEDISGFYDISSISMFEAQKQILFNPLNMFKIIVVDRIQKKIKLQYTDMKYLKNTKNQQQQPLLKELLTYQKWIKNIKVENQGDILKEEGNYIQARKYYQKFMLWALSKIKFKKYLSYDYLMGLYGKDEKIMKNLTEISKYFSNNYEQFLKQEFEQIKNDNQSTEKYVTYIFLKFMHLKLNPTQLDQTKQDSTQPHQTVIITNITNRLLSLRIKQSQDYFILFNIEIIEKRQKSLNKNQHIKQMEDLKRQKIRNLLDLGRVFFYKNRSEDSKKALKRKQIIEYFSDPDNQDTQMYADYLAIQNVLLTFQTDKVIEKYQWEQSLANLKKIKQIVEKNQNINENKIFRNKLDEVYVYLHMGKFQQSYKHCYEYLQQCKNSFCAYHEYSILFRVTLGQISYYMGNPQTYKLISQEVTQQQNQIFKRFERNKNNFQISPVEILLFRLLAKCSYENSQFLLHYQRLSKLLELIIHSKLTHYTLYDLYQSYSVYSQKILFASYDPSQSQKVPRQYEAYIAHKTKVIEDVQAKGQFSFLTTEQLLVLIKIAYFEKEYEQMYIRARQLRESRQNDKLQSDMMFYVGQVYLYYAETRVRLQKEDEVQKSIQKDKILQQKLARNQCKQTNQQSEANKKKKKDLKLKLYRKDAAKIRGKATIEEVTGLLNKIQAIIKVYSQKKVASCIFHARTQVLYSQILLKIREFPALFNFLSQNDIEIQYQLLKAQRMVKKKYTETQQYAILCFIQAQLHYQKQQKQAALEKVNQCLQIRKRLHNYTEENHKYKPTIIFELQQFKQKISAI